MKRPEISKILLGVFLITIIALSSFILVFNTQLGKLQKQNDSLQSQNSELLDQVGSLQSQNEILQNQTDDLQNQTSDLQEQTTRLNSTIQSHSNTAKIVAVSFGVWGVPAGVTADIGVNVTIVNTGINDLEGLTLAMEINGTSSALYHWNTYSSIGIHSNEIKDVQSSILTSLDKLGQIAGHTAEFKLMLANETLDELNVPVSSSWG